MVSKALQLWTDHWFQNETWKVLRLASGFVFEHLVSIPGKPCVSPQHPGPAGTTHRPH